MDQAKTRAAPDKTVVECQIAATDKQIDPLASELHGFAKEETRIVERGTN